MEDLLGLRLDDVDLVERCRNQFRAEGICVLPNFLRDDTVQRLVDECRELAPLGHRSASRANPYLADPVVDAAPGDPRGALIESQVVAVAYDLFPPDSLLRRLYEWDGLLNFVAAVLDRGPLHRYADPFGALNLAVMEEGDEIGWHFDFTDFVVSLALQAPEGGGRFENVPKIRTRDDDALDVVAAVLAGEADHLVRIEPMTPGTLMLFNGSCSLHRVSAVEGPVPRHVALLAYDTVPGRDSSDVLKMNRYGRLPAPAVR